ncbi:unnamed protein product [Heterobilharzia americana]|nr:unnamed protein product [Heterobilharzia americana]
MSALKLEDPTVDVGDIERYRMAFLMQFFVQHKRRFRFPRLRLQDLYQKVLKDPDPVAFCDLAARILRFLNHDDPEICMANIDQALDRFAIDKRTSYRINMQRHRNGKLVHQLGPAARAALLDNLIESVYDEQPDFNFTTCFNSSMSNGVRGNSNGPGSTGFDRIDNSDLFASGDIGSRDGNNVFTEAEDVNVLIKAGQDAQGCSYYYMDDLRLYRERPQTGISSQWDIAVGPTAEQWLAFIMSLSRNEEEYDLYCFLKQDLFDLVKESLDALELHTTNTELDSNYLRTKEMNELAELKRRQLGNTHKSISLSSVDNDKLHLNNIVNMSVNGPKSASPAFSGGHGISGIGSSGSSAAPLTPSSARTPTSAPPASTVQQQLSLPPSDCQETLQTPMKTETSISNQSTVWSQDVLSVKMRTLSGQSPCDTDLVNTPKSEGITTECGTSSFGSFVTSNQDTAINSTHSITSTSTTMHSLSSPVSVSTGRYNHLPNGSGTMSNSNESVRNLETEPTTVVIQSQNSNNSMVSESAKLLNTTTTTCCNTTPNTNTSFTATPANNTDINNNFPISTVTNQLPPSSPAITTTPGVPINESIVPWNSNMASSPSFQRDRKLPPTSDALSMSTQPPSQVQSNQKRTNSAVIDEAVTLPNYRSYASSQQVPQNQVSANVASKQMCAFDSHVAKGSPNESMDPANTKLSSASQFRHLCMGQQDISPCSGAEYQLPLGSNSKQCIGPATALVSPMVGIPDGGMPLTQEQWENRKSKIAQLEKIHSTLSKSKSASTPGAMAAATAGAVLQQRLMRNSVSMQQQQQQQQSTALNNPALQPPSAGNNTLPYPESLGICQMDTENYNITRQGCVVGSSINNESAQQEWDRLCSDYQRGKNDASVMRYPGSRQMGFFDTTGYSIPQENSLSSQCSVPPMAAGTMMLPSGQVMIMDQQACQPPAYQSGPPVVMVPPNNSNMCSSNPGYPPSNSLNCLTEEPGRTIGPVGQEHMSSGIVPSAGQKRSYHATSGGESWLSPNPNRLSMSPVPNIENSTFVGHIQPNSISSVCRASQMLSVVPSPVGSVPPTCMPITNTNQQSVGRGSGSTKPGTKKRKAAGSGRSSVVTNTGYNSSLPAVNQQPSPTNQNSHCLKQSTTTTTTTNTSGTTPNKLLNPAYSSDDLQTNHFPRSIANHPRPTHQVPPPGRPPFQPTDPCMMHYSDMMCGPNSGQFPLEQSGNMDMMMMVNPRHSGTPKSGEPFLSGPMSPNISCSSATAPGSRASSNCSNNYGPGSNYGSGGGNMSNKPPNHSYFGSSDMMGPNSESVGMRTTPNTPCTQHLTSASLASLARLSQMSGPEGPYVPSSSSSLYTSTIGSSLPTMSGHGAHLNRTGSMTSFHADGNPVMPPQGTHHVLSQGVRNHNSVASPGHCGTKSHLCNPNQSLSSNMTSNNFNLPHSLSSTQTLPIHSKFNAQGYPHTNPQLQPTLQQHSQTPAGGSSLPSPIPNLPVVSQQPPSIQVNNTFFNAQLNVQQMNYQHVSAPGSTGQMQIHFAQQQQPPHEQVRSVRQPESTIRMTNPTPNEYNPMSSNNPSLLYSSDPVNHRLDCSSKPEVPSVLPSSSVITSSVCTPLGSSVGGYGNASIQITPRTPHTIQYLPTVTPQVSNQGPPGLSPGSNQIPRSGSVRGYQYIPPDSDNNPHLTDNSIRGTPFQSNQSYPNQNISGQPGQFYSPNQHYPSSQSVVQQTYVSNFQPHNKNPQQSGQFPSRPNNSAYTWNEANFDSLPLGPSGPLTVSSANDTGLNSFTLSSNNQNQISDTRIVRGMHQQGFRDGQMMNYSSCNNEMALSSVDPLSTDNMLNHHQMFPNSFDVPIQQRVNIGQQQQSQYIRQPTGKPPSYSSTQSQNQSNHIHHQQSSYHQYYQNQQQQQHHQMMMSSSMCDYSGSNDWSSTNQVQFVMSNSRLVQLYHPLQCTIVTVVILLIICLLQELCHMVTIIIIIVVVVSPVVLIIVMLLIIVIIIIFYLVKITIYVVQHQIQALTILQIWDMLLPLLPLLLLVNGYLYRIQ